MTEKEIFMAGWYKAFRYCNPDVGCDFGANPDNAEEAWERFQKERRQDRRDQDDFDSWFVSDT